MSRPPDDLTPEEASRLVEEAEAAAATLSPEERREIRRGLAEAADRGALRAILNGDLDRADVMLRIGEIFGTESDAS